MKTLGHLQGNREGLNREQEKSGGVLGRMRSKGTSESSWELSRMSRK